MFNEADNVKNCISIIKLVLDRNFRNDWEIVVVDDGSNDDTYKNLTEVKKKIKNLKILRHDLIRVLVPPLRQDLQKQMEI